MEPTAVSSFERARASIFQGGSDYRRLTVNTLDELLSLATGLLALRAVRDLSAARARVAEDRFNLVVLGEFKRGKSTLINALVGRAVLPTGVVPLTSVVTAIGAGDRDRLVVRYGDGREEEHPLSELANYVTEARNPGNDLGVELARRRARPRFAARGASSSSTRPGSARSTVTTPTPCALSSLGSTRRFACWMPGSHCLKPSATCCSTCLVERPGC